MLKNLHERHDPGRGAPVPFNHWKHRKTSQVFQRLLPAETTSFMIIVGFYSNNTKDLKNLSQLKCSCIFLIFFSGADRGGQWAMWFAHCPAVLSTWWHHFCLWLSWTLPAHTNAQSPAGLGKNWSYAKKFKSRGNKWRFLQLPRNSQILGNSDSLSILLSYLIV